MRAKDHDRAQVNMLAQMLEPHDRAKFIGGSDIAAVLGVSSWTTPVQLWEQKVGRAANDDQVSEQLARIRERGRKLEPFIVDMVIDKLRDEGHEVELVARNQRYFSKRYPFLTSEVDFELRVDGELMNGDAKSVSSYARKAWGEEGSENIPIEYMAQFQQGLGLAPGKRRRCIVAALRSFDDVDIFWTVRDDETIDAMRRKAVKFWREHVLPHVPPDPKEFADLRLLFPVDNSRSIEATDEIAAAVERLKAIAQQQKDLEREKVGLQFDIGEFMGEHALLTRGPRNLITWETRAAERFDLRAFKSAHPDWFALFMKEGRSRTFRLAGRR